MMTLAPLVAVLPHARIHGWPRHARGARVPYSPLANALTRTWTTDAHTAGYSVPAVERRLTLDLLAGGKRREADDE